MNKRRVRFLHRVWCSYENRFVTEAGNPTYFIYMYSEGELLVRNKMDIEGNEILYIGQSCSLGFLDVKRAGKKFYYNFEHWTSMCKWFTNSASGVFLKLSIVCSFQITTYLMKEAFPKPINYRISIKTKGLFRKYFNLLRQFQAVLNL